MKISPYWATDPKPITPARREWAEYCLSVMASDPETAGDYAFKAVGLASGVARPEYGLGVYDLQCQMCDATWSGVPGDPCWWCERNEQIALDWQIDLLLTPPDVDPDDANYVKRMEGWATRMVVGIESGLITEQQAATALRRTQIRRSA